MEILKNVLVLLIVLFGFSNSDLGHVDEIVLTNQPVAVTFTSPDALLRFPPWNFHKYREIEIQFHTREPMGIMFFVGSSGPTTDCIGLEIFNSNLQVFGNMLGKDFRIRLNPRDTSVSTGKFHKVLIEMLPTNYLTMKFDNAVAPQTIQAPGKLEFDSYTYIGGIDSVTRLPWIAYSEVGFTGCLSYIRVNGEKFVDVKKHAKQLEMQGAETGACQTTVARCQTGVCGAGQCYERSYNLKDQLKNFYCDCSGTSKSYSLAAANILRGEPCVIDAPKFVCNSKSYILYNFDNTRKNHLDDISIDFRTSSMREPLFFMKTGIGEEVSTFISAEVIGGQIVVIIKLVDTNNPNYKNTFFSSKSNLNDGQWHSLKLLRFVYNVKLSVDDKSSTSREKLYRSVKGEKFFNNVNELFLGSTTRPTGNDKCTGEFKNFYWNNDDLLGKRNRIGNYNSQIITEKPTLPILPPFPRQPPIPCAISPSHSYTTVSRVPLVPNGAVFMIEFKTKYDGIIWHASNPYRSDQWVTILINLNSVIVVYGIQSNVGVEIIELTRGGISIRDNTWHRVIFEINKLKESMFVFIDDVEALTKEIRLPNSMRQLENMNSVTFSIGGIQDSNQYSSFYSMLQDRAPEVAKTFSNEIEFKFVGCLGELLMNNDNFTMNFLIMPGVLTVPSNTMVCRSCQVNFVKCPKNYCQNGGKCFNVNDNQIACNCEGTNFYGKFCDIKSPTCNQSTCKNGGSCKIVNNNKFCDCTGTGFVGGDCEISLCANYKCLNNGVCKIVQSMPSCDCSMTLYEGLNCEISKCPSDFCQNNGRCELHKDSQLPYCICKSTGFTGSRCNKPICGPQQCSGNGNCVTREDKAVCYCNEQFTGESCEKPICTKDQCLNGGTCNVVSRKPVCVCSSDFVGIRCETPKPCPEGSCFYGGTCKINNGIALCDCSKTDYIGLRCDTPKRCPDKYCENKGICSVVGNTFLCDCSSTGYAGEKCTNKLGCPANYCKNGGVCGIANGKYHCDCSFTAYGGDVCDQNTNGIMCDYKNPGYAIRLFNPNLVSDGITTSMGFQTYVGSGTLFCYLTVDDKYWSVKLVGGKPVVDINGMMFNMKTSVNDGAYHVIKVSRDATNFMITLGNPVVETLLIPIGITTILTLQNNIIVYIKLTLCNSCPETSNKNRFQGAIGNARSGPLSITDEIKSGMVPLFGGLNAQMTPMAPLFPIPIVQPCTNDYCKNGAKCKILNYGPVCICGITGFTGNLCDIRIYSINSAPPTPGYVISNVVPSVPTNFDFISFIAQSSESFTPLISVITTEGHYLEFKIINGFLHFLQNGKNVGSLSNLPIPRNFPSFFKLVNLLGRVTVYVNGTRYGHIKLNEPILMKNSSIQISKVIIGANRNMDESIKGYIADYQHNNFNLIGPTGLINTTAVVIPNISIKQWQKFGRSMPDVKKVFNGNHGGVVFHFGKLSVLEGFGAGAIVPMSTGPIILGAELLAGIGVIMVNPLILGIILAFLLLIMAIIWAFGHFICHHAHAGGPHDIKFGVNNPMAVPLLEPKILPMHSIGISDGAALMNGYSGLEQTNVNMFQSGRMDTDMGAMTLNPSRFDNNKSNAMYLSLGAGNKSTFGVATGQAAYNTFSASNNNSRIENALDLERLQSSKFANTYAQQDMGFNQQMGQTNAFTGEELKLDCCVLSSDSTYAITGSVAGPPQVWDLKSGSIIQIFDGSNQACTSLQLALENTLLIGLVNQNQQFLHLKMLMIWTLPTGQLIDLQDEMSCTTCNVSYDGMNVILADEMKKSSITIYNLINETKRKQFYNRSDNMPADGIQFLKATKNMQFIIAGYQAIENISVYMVFDMKANNKEEIGVLKMKSNLDCCEIINNNEAIVGSKLGELIIWNLEHVRAVRQMTNPESSFNPHETAINCLAISKDGSIVASGSLYSSIRVWAMEEETMLHSLDNHSNAVQSLALSNDNELLLSGTADGWIRVWSMTDGQEICSFNSNISINKVLVSNDKSIIVGLGENEGINKLVMMKILRNVHHVKRTIDASDNGSGFVSPSL